MLRDEWNAAAITDEADGAVPYPGDWHEAQDRLIKFHGDGSWGTWEITAHDVESPDKPSAVPVFYHCEASCIGGQPIGRSLSLSDPSGNMAMMVAEGGTRVRRVLSRVELRWPKASRDEFLAQPRRPITVVLDGIVQNYNIGAIFRLCDAFLIERLVICGITVELRKRKLVQAARGTQHWVPWQRAESAVSAVAAAKSAGAWVVAVEQTSAGTSPEDLAPVFPACPVLGSEMRGVSQEIVDMADAAVAIPMLGMANSINVATAAAIMLYRLSVLLERRLRTPEVSRSGGGS
jgi:tRNA G18 (ribose-2'-O)-methylase SpoU